jgi:hypothetical protein
VIPTKLHVAAMHFESESGLMLLKTIFRLEKSATIHYSTGCCSNPFSLVLKHFLIYLRLVPSDSKTRPSASNSWNRFSFTSPRFMNKELFNERSKRFSFGQQPVKI